MKVLQVFIEAVEAGGAEISEPWALDLAERLADRGDTLPVRFPLLRDVLVPALLRGVVANRPGCARWLAFLVARNHQLGRVLGSLPEHQRSPQGLLIEALRIDPGDNKARRTYVEKMQAYFSYTLHEIPAGVLFGHDGATPDECAELTRLISDFRDHVEILGETSRYAKLIDDCKYHYQTYRNYLSGGVLADSYTAFLAHYGRRSTTTRA